MVGRTRGGGVLEGSEAQADNVSWWLTGGVREKGVKGDPNWAVSCNQLGVGEAVGGAGSFAGKTWPHLNTAELKVPVRHALEVLRGGQ